MPTRPTAADGRQVRRWHTPEPYALAFEDTATGDGRIFALGAVRWEGDSWPLQYADEMLTGHQGAELVGDIQLITRAGRRLPAAGDLYADTDTGAQVVELLERDAPLGVSVDLDDVTVELVDTRPEHERDAEPLLAAAGGGRVTVRLPHLSVMHTDTGHRVVGPLRSALTPVLTTHGLTAAGCAASAGDPDAGGEVLLVEQAGEILMRITDARLRGATLVSIPAFSEARIALVEETQPDPYTDPGTAAADAPQVGELMMEVIDYVSSAAGPVRPGQVAEALGLAGHTARTYLSRAYQAGRLARPTRGLYTAVAATRTADAATEVTAAAVGNLRLPVHPDRNRPWDGPAAASRVLEWANAQAEASDDPPSRWLQQAFLWQDPDGNPNTLAAYSLGFADIIGNELRIIARGVFATAGGRGVDAADIPETDKAEIRDRICDLYRRLANEFDEDLVCPWQRDEEAAADPVMASAWAEFDALPPLPAAWFAEPTDDELPADSGGVHITDDGRIYGWVAQRGVPHEGYPGQNLTIDDLEPIDTTWFLRKKFRLDNGDSVPLGPFVMNVGHHRDGGNCETQACLWDDSRTIAGLITVGFNDRGMWFTGAAAPWLSDWDKMAFLACQPSYHMTAKPDGGYKLGAVLAVPRPGHPSRLVAAAVVDRANLLLTPASSSPAPASAPGPMDLTQLVPALAAAVVDEQERRLRAREEAAALQREMAEMRTELVAAMRAEIEGEH